MSPRRRARPGVILVIVIAMLALSLSLGLAFVFYAQQQATAMRIHREAAQAGRAARVNVTTRGSTDEAPPQAFDIASAALGQLIYDVPDDERGVWSGLRGAGLARGAYGLAYSGPPQEPRYQGNTVPFNGVGRYRSRPGEYVPSLLAALDDANNRAVNYTYHAADGFIRDPERIGYRASMTATAWDVGGVRSTENYFPINAPYTYPDEKDIALAAMRASDGRVLVPSFHRPSAFGPLAPDNPNWTNAQGKYLIHRPRPVDMGPGFPAVPANADGSYTGDVEQVEGKRVPQNDSLWTDLDLPVHTWRGRQYKPLVAFLVLDLDGRINVNVAGNRRGINNTNASNQGWGGWEADLNPLLEFDESTRVFLNSGGRYGGDQIPNARYNPDSAASGNVAPCRVFNPFYARIDFDGSMVTNSSVQPRMQLPQAPSTRTSPIYPARYAGGSTAERTDHPLLFNSYLLGGAGQVSTSDRGFPVSDMRLLNYKFNGDDNHYSQSDLGRLLPQNLGRSFTPGKNGWPATAVNPRFVLTSVSNDFDRVGLSPWQFDEAPSFVLEQPAPVNGVYPPAAPPSAAPVAFPQLARRTSQASAARINDFDPATWKARRAELGPVDLGRALADYRIDPTKPYEEPGNVTAESAARANDDRQRLAKDLFDRLCWAVGADLSTATPGTSEYHALRYLAQLAVNIVDQRDPDDYITAFVWNPLDPADPRNAANFAEANLKDRVVFGTELPRLVINEACMRVENGALLPGMEDTDPGLLPLGHLPHATFYNVKLWVELHNPLTPGTASTDNLSHKGGAPLTFDGRQVYRLLLTEPNKKLRHVENVKGDPDAPIRRTVNLPAGDHAAAQGVIPVSNASYIQPRGPSSSFYVIGPEPTPGDMVIPSAGSADMKFRLKPDDYRNGDGARTTLLLQRLACPHLPPAADNPYITVDLMDFRRDMINDARLFDDNGPIILPLPLGIVFQRAYGRKQPYAGHPSQVVAQNLIPAPVAGFNHTFFRHNGQGDLITKAGLTLTQPFDWLTHLDREPVSPVELMQVSAYKPHELTQQFIVEAGGEVRKFQQAAPWGVDGSRLHRALSLLTTRDRSIGMPMGGRVPGRVNINTVWDEPAFQALCAANSANTFTTADVKATWQKLLASRSPAGAPAQHPGEDRPFKPYSAPITPAGDVQFPGGGIGDTLMRPDPRDPGRRLLDTGETHPYLRNELLSKIHGQLTTRSNVFAVWMTVGYFEVTDAAARPVKLGPEMGFQNGTNIRHRFFAIVDRTNVTIDPTNPTQQGCRPVYLSFEPESDVQTPGDVVVTLPAVSYSGGVLRGVYDDAAWELRTGDQLLVDPGPRQERVGVRIIDFSPERGARVSLACRRPHDRGCAILLGNATPGNPGPQPGFHVRNPRYSGVVRYFAVLD